MFCKDSVSWLYALEENHSWESRLTFTQDYAFKDTTGVVRLILEREGRITVTSGYAWNGCSPKFCLFDILIGTPDGVVHSVTGKPKTYYASLIHDALYQFLPDGLPLKRSEADRCFLKLMAETGFRPRMLYYIAVSLFGGIVLPIERAARKTSGTTLPL